MIAGALTDETLLPRIREDLRLHPATTRADGSKGWLIHDPVSNSYQEVGIESYAALRCWSNSTTVGDLRRDMKANWGTETSLDDVSGLLTFLDNSHLLVEASGGWRAYSLRAEQGKQSPLGWLLHNYLYFQIRSSGRMGP